MLYWYADLEVECEAEQPSSSTATSLPKFRRQEVDSPPDDPDDDGYRCPWAGGSIATTQPPSTSASPTTTTQQTSTMTEQPTSYPTIYYDDPTAAGCADDGCTSCKTDFEQRCTSMDSHKKVYCHCEWIYGCSRGATNLGMDSYPFKS